MALRLAESDGPATIELVLPRTSALVRKAAGEPRPQLLAANIDVVFIVTARGGDFNLARMERYLALVRESGATPVIVVNKTDLANDVVGPTGRIAGLLLVCQFMQSARGLTMALVISSNISRATGLWSLSVRRASASRH